VRFWRGSVQTNLFQKRAHVMRRAGAVALVAAVLGGSDHAGRDEQQSKTSVVAV